MAFVSTTDVAVAADDDVLFVDETFEFWFKIAGKRMLKKRTQKISIIFLREEPRNFTL